MVDGYVATLGRSGADRSAVQRWQLERWIARRGWRLGRIFEDRTDVGGTGPALRERALARVEGSESDGLVVLELRQLGASLEDTVRAIERISAAGGAFASVHEGIDLSTPGGRQIVRMLMSVVEW